MSLKKAYHLANSGRKGPVVIDLPMDIQVGELSQEDIKAADDLETPKVEFEINSELNTFLDLFKNSKKTTDINWWGSKTRKY